MEKSIVDKPDVYKLVEAPHDQDVERIVSKLIHEKLTQKHLEMIDRYDQQTYDHCLRVCMGCIEMGCYLRLAEDELERLARAALLHDVGKCHISHDIIAKPGRYTPEERREMQAHAVESYKILLEDFPTEARIAGAHHWAQKDGYGVPPDEATRFYSDILSVVDKYDALVSKRYYKNEFSEEKTESIIREESTVDPELKERILRRFEELLKKT